tara:strand:- start:524 stop:724 length:201 start_codon:yes stop_codon:yes gene_type:complete
MEAPNEKTKELVELLELMRVILKHAKKVDPKEEFVRSGTNEIIEAFDDTVVDGMDWLEGFQLSKPN